MPLVVPIHGETGKQEDWDRPLRRLPLEQSLGGVAGLDLAEGESVIADEPFAIHRDERAGRTSGLCMARMAVEPVV